MEYYGVIECMGFSYFSLLTNLVISKMYGLFKSITRFSTAVIMCHVG
jgi:hypothetical protein